MIELAAVVHLNLPETSHPQDSAKRSPILGQGKYQETHFWISGKAGSSCLSLVDFLYFVPSLLWHALEKFEPQNM